MSTLYIVATPIGNLEDITLRALRVLKEVDYVFAEDTREALKLLKHFTITTQVERYDEHSHERQSKKVIELLKEGKDVAYISDAGTPGISDPGAMLVSAIREHVNDGVIVPIPGPSALTTLLSVCGVTNTRFTFLGFLPHKKGRQTLFNEISSSQEVFLFYESPHRIMKTLESLKDTLSETRTIVVGRELTKVHEEIIQGSPSDIYRYYISNKDKVRGEFVILIH